MRIYLAENKDVEELSRLYEKVVGYLYKTVNYPKWIMGEYPSRQTVEDAVACLSMYRCDEEDKIVGAFILSEDPAGDYDGVKWSKDLKRGEYLVIHTLAVDPDFYGRGAGREMVDFALKKAQRENYSAVRLDVVPDNYPARRLYEKTGFMFVGEDGLKRDLRDIPKFALYEYVF